MHSNGNSANQSYGYTGQIVSDENTNPMASLSSETAVNSVSQTLTGMFKLFVC